ncbi:MAG: hypothetical protein HQL49_10315 [Gammaproteobacteria bacterium]|nr:hypothetical protein [Gammaproteobacteria bacterium]
MIPFDELYQEQDAISELTQVITALIQKRRLCDNRITNQLFNQFTEMVNKHLDRESQLVCSCLLTSHNKEAVKHAMRSLEGGKEIKRIFNQFVRKWFRKGSLHIKEHSLFVQEAEEMVELVLDRFQTETEILYPLARKECEIRSL